MRNGRGESIGGLGAGELDWHTDQSYVTNPSTGSMLYMVEMPPAGGRTWWANLKLAWEALPDATKRRIEPLHVVYDYLLRQSTYDDEAPMSEELRRRTPPVSHPLVNVHPVTGEKALYLDPVTAAGIEGWPEDEGRELLADEAPFGTATSGRSATSSCGTTASSCTGATSSTRIEATSSRPPWPRDEGRDLPPSAVARHAHDEVTTR